MSTQFVYFFIFCIYLSTSCKVRPSDFHTYIHAYIFTFTYSDTIQWRCKTLCNMNLLRDTHACMSMFQHYYISKGKVICGVGLHEYNAKFICIRKSSGIMGKMYIFLCNKCRHERLHNCINMRAELKRIGTPK